VSRLRGMLHSGELNIAKDLNEAQALLWELQDFRATASDTGNWRFGARSGRHDDLVLALAIGCWWNVTRNTRSTLARISSNERPAGGVFESAGFRIPHPGALIWWHLWRPWLFRHGNGTGSGTVSLLALRLPVADP